jgi:FlaG/FlaF family flagellin (archaellin)
VVSNDPGITQVGIGTLLMSLSEGKVTLHINDSIASASYKKVYSSYTATSAEVTETTKVFNSLDLSKSLYEMIYSHTDNKVVVNVYSLELPTEYKIVTITDGKIDYDNTGFSIKRVKKTYTFTSPTQTSTDTQSITLKMNPKTNTAYSASNTYATTPIKDSIIMSMFGLEGDVWA